MTTPGPHECHVIPLAIYPPSRLHTKTVSLLPGVSLSLKVPSRLGRLVDARSESLPVSPGFLATHLLVLDEREYLLHLKARLQSWGVRPADYLDMRLDIAGVIRQVSMALTLTARLGWAFGGHHRFEAGRRPVLGGYSHHPTTSVSSVLQYALPSDWAHTVSPTRLRTTALLLDPYYRSGVWWVDRLSSALGYLWSSLTSPHPELAFAGMCMALEALVTSQNNEVTHLLAQRCALLSPAFRADRSSGYHRTKELYSLRSKIVHGKSSPRKGPITWESLSITAKQSMVPRSKYFEMLAATIDVINGVLASESLMQLLQTRQSEDKTNAALDAFFNSALLG